MPKFSANLSFLYPELPFLERFGAAAKDGFKAVEYVGPYAETKEKVAETLKTHGLTQALFNFPAGNWDAGERGIACLPDRIAEFREGVAKALDYAEALGCKKLNVLAGIAPASISHGVLEQTLIENLQYAAERCSKAGVQLVFEPINLRDMPGYFVSTTNHAERIIELAGVDNLYIQYDFYHMQIMQGDLVPTYDRLKARIGHVQIADNPGRNEPGTGEINYAFIFEALDRLGYDGWVGCEYKPKSGTTAGLGWMKPYLS
ncbi:MAG TPA: 2-oxo-tetronate isomerase [Arsenicitalea sp.]|nr:2-oxo-tetronate isomerase [Arsenicitalea sp.]